MKYPTGQRVLIRTRNSGVTIGKLKAVETKEGITTYHIRKGVRIWSWTSPDDSFTLACSGLATKGAHCKIEHHPRDAFILESGGSEILPVTDEAWDLIRNNWTEK